MASYNRMSGVVDERSPGEIIRSLRIAAGLTQKQLADSIEPSVHFTTVAKLETGKMAFTYDWGKRLSVPLGVSISSFFGVDDVDDTIQRVPCYNQVSDTRGARGVEPIGFVAVLSPASANLIGYSFVGVPDVIGDNALWVAVVSLSQAKLTDGHTYLIFHESFGRNLIARYSESANLFVLILIPFSRTHVECDASARVIGRVVELLRSC